MRGEGEMRKERVDWIVSGLKRFESTDGEQKLIHGVEASLCQKGLTDGEALVLENLYMTKTKLVRDTILSMLHQSSEKGAVCSSSRMRGSGVDVNLRF